MIIEKDNDLFLFINNLNTDRYNRQNTNNQQDKKQQMSNFSVIWERKIEF